MPHTHDHHNATIGGRPDHDGRPLNEHPPWCSAQHCLVNEHGVHVHQQQPVQYSPPH